MPDREFMLSGPETVMIAGQTIDKLLRAGDGDAALLYLYMLKMDEPITPEKAAAALNKGPGWVASAMAMLSRLGLIRSDAGIVESHPTPATEEPRRYTVDEIKKEIDNGSDFSALIDEAQRSLGILSPDGLERLFGIYNDLHMPAEVVMLLITHCIVESRRKGSGRLPSMRYIEKAAYTWEREGIFTLERAEEYLKTHEARRSAQGEIKAALQIKSDRELTDSEKYYVNEWITMGFEADAVEIAYDRTVLKAGKPAIRYTDAIMKSWHSKGLHTAQEIMEKEGRPGRDSPQRFQKDPKQKFGDADSEEINRMQRLLDKIKED